MTLDATARMRLSLDGLSVGDALGETFFGPSAGVLDRIRARRVPRGPWRYTDDTEMALSIASVLEERGRVDQDLLAGQFAARYDPGRGYGAGAHGLLQALRLGAEWREAAGGMFGGKGSYGNGGAMRAAPVGAFFADRPDAAVENAALSARVTHAHPEGAAGAVAAASAAALAWRAGEAGGIEWRDFFDAILDAVPEGMTRGGIEAARDLGPSAAVHEAAERLGSGYEISAQDTVPFCLWCAARHLDDFEEAFWTTVSGLGDRDTTCAIVGGITALSARERGIPPAWIAAREPLPPLELL